MAKASGTLIQDAHGCEFTLKRAERLAFLAFGILAWAGASALAIWPTTSVNPVTGNEFSSRSGEFVTLATAAFIAGAALVFLALNGRRFHSFKAPWLEGDSAQIHPNEAAKEAIPAFRRSGQKADEADRSESPASTVSGPAGSGVNLTWGPLAGARKDFVPLERSELTEATTPTAASWSSITTDGTVSEMYRAHGVPKRLFDLLRNHWRFASPPPSSRDQIEWASREANGSWVVSFGRNDVIGIDPVGLNGPAGSCPFPDKGHS